MSSKKDGGGGWGVPVFWGSSNQRPVQLTQSELTSKPPDVTRKIKQLQCCPLWPETIFFTAAVGYLTTDPCRIVLELFPSSHD
jgi:hypothetical protein